MLSLVASVALLAPSLVPEPAPARTTARRGFVAQSVGAVCASAFAAAAPCQAGYVTNLGFGDPSQTDTDVDSSTLQSSAVQTDLKSVQKYADMASKLNAKYQADPQADIREDLKAFDRADLRTTLNSVNTIFGEDFQKQSDRMVRNVIQDLSELDALAPIKDGVPRTSKKIQAVDRFIVKLDKDLAEFLKYVPSK